MYNKITTKTKFNEPHQTMLQSHSLYTDKDYLSLDISPSDDNQYWKKKYTHARLNCIRQFYMNHLDQIRKYSKEYVEVIEISKTGRIHYHITLISNDITSLVGYIGYMRYSTRSNIKLDLIEDINLRLAYQKKDRKNKLSEYIKE